MQDPYDCGDSAADQTMDLPDALARTEQQLKRLRPCQTQLDLAEVERCAAAHRMQAPASGFSKAHLLCAVAASWLCGIAVGALALYFAAPRILAAGAGDLETASHVAAADPLVAGTDSDASDGHEGDNRIVIDAHASQDEDPPSAQVSPVRQPQHGFAAERVEHHHLLVNLIVNEQYQASLRNVGDAEPLRATSWRRWADASPLTLPETHSFPARGELATSDHRAAERPSTTTTSPRGIGDTAPGLLSPSGPIPHRQWLDELIAHPAELL